MNKSYIFAGISIFFWASTATLTKIMLRDMDSIQILCISTFFASLILFLINLFSKKLPLIKQYKFADYIKFFLTGCLGIFLYNFLLYTALFYLPAQEGFIINYLWPIMVVIFATILLKEKLTIRKIIAILLSFLGIVIVVTKGNLFELNLSSPLGIAMAVSAAVSYGLFSVIIKKFSYDRTISMMFYYISAFIVSFIAMITVSGMPNLNLPQILGLGWNGIFSQAIAYMTWSLALQYGDTHKIANLAFITPFLSLVYIYIFLGEEISIFSLLGLVIIVSGILIQNYRKRNKTL
ncbi:MAG: DMT family transporter [Oscillospiraceae bacterium]|nr:DMT family transporter [Oscillospiraceae bacterium]